MRRQSRQLKPKNCKRLHEPLVPESKEAKFEAIGAA
jgi:hypothetical protein